MEGKAGPWSKRLRSQPGQLVAPPVVTTGTQGMGQEARQPQHLENIIEILYMANRRDPWCYWARVAHINYQEVLREDDCVTWRFYCAILRIRNVSLKASFQSS